MADMLAGLCPFFVGPWPSEDVDAPVGVERGWPFQFGLISPPGSLCNKEECDYDVQLCNEPRKGSSSSSTLSQTIFPSLVDQTESKVAAH